MAEKVEVLLFPELNLSGYRTTSELYYEAQPRDGPAIRELIRFLGTLDADITISVGLAESHGGCLYNTQVLLDKHGERYYYAKTTGRTRRWARGHAGTPVSRA